MKDNLSDRPFYVAMFVSRNKDNAGVKGFKQRTRSFLTQKTTEELRDKFEEFCSRGVPGELSRFYISVNERKHEVVLQSLQHYLIDHPNVNLTKIESLIASLAMKKGTAQTKRFLFDYDGEKEYIGYFVENVEHALGCSNYVSFYETLNGYAVVTERGFDTRELLEKWDDVELKRDGMLYVESLRNFT